MVCIGVSHERGVWKLRVHVLVVLIFICLISTAIMSSGNLESDASRRSRVEPHPDAGGSAPRLHSRALGSLPLPPEKRKMLCLLISSRLTASLYGCPAMFRVSRETADGVL